MNSAATATTVEMDSTGFDDLKNQLITSKTAKVEEPKKEKEPPKEKRNDPPPNKKYVFKKGDQTFEIDEDFELEFMADKRPTKLTLRELKDRAAGDIAVKNRMHALAEEKKKVQATLKEFADLAKKDPLAALEYISGKAKEADGEFEYNKYIEKLGEQAEKLGKMDEKERKAWELEKKLQKAEQDLSYKERQAAVVRKKQEILSEHPEIGDSEFGQMVDAVLENETLAESLENESDVMEKVEELIEETLTQRDIVTVIREINPDYANDNELIFSLSDQIRQNPDLDEEDVRDIMRSLIQPQREEAAPQLDEKQRDVRTLSEKARQSTSVQHMKEKGASTFDLLKQQLLERKKELSTTPLYKR